MAYAIKAEVADITAELFSFPAQKTMYGGKHAGEGDTVFLFASENEGGKGLFARGTVVKVRAVPLQPDLARQTPRIDLTVKRTASAKRALGRKELKPFDNWTDGRPETELNFKFYRQATNKVVGISEATAAFLEEFFQADR